MAPFVVGRGGGCGSCAGRCYRVSRRGTPHPEACQTDVIKENELNNMIKLIVLSFNILKYETFIALLESVNKVQEEKVGIKTGGTCIRKTQKYLQKKIKKIRKNKKTRKYFYK
jgi:hypothetical protein